MSTYSIEEHKIHKDMFYVVYPDGELSFDFYNLSRANDHCRRLEQMDVERMLELMEEMANAPKEEMGKRQPGERCTYEIQRNTTEDTK